MKKKKKRIKKPKPITYPQQLNREDYFKCPIWFGDAPEFVDEINKASDSYIDIAKKNMQPDIDKRNKTNKTKGDLGSVYHSTTLIGDSKFKVLTDYIGATSHNLLLEMGFDMSGHQLFTTEMWVQEFAKSGGGGRTASGGVTGGSGGAGYALIKENAYNVPVAASAPGVWSMQSVYTNVRAGTWTN